MAGLNPPRPLAADDDREAFDCGRASLNNWFHRHAWRNQQSGASRTSVLCQTGGPVVGYVSLSAAQIERAFLPKPAQRNQPTPLPVILLGQLAVDHRHHGRGYARSLIWFALTTAVRLSRDIGCFGVVTQPVDDAVRAFYHRFGFEELVGDPERSLIVRMNDLKQSGFGERI